MATNDNTRADTPLTASGDHAICDAYAARRREFEENYHVDMTLEQEEAYFDRLHTREAVILNTTATTIEGVLAKLRVAFLHQEPSAWSDRAITDPSHPDFVAGLSAADIGDRLAWSAIEDLARIGGVDLAAQGA